MVKLAGARERAIAHVARAIYDYFTFDPRGSPP